MRGFARVLTRDFARGFSRAFASEALPYLLGKNTEMCICVDLSGKGPLLGLSLGPSL